MNYEDSTVKVYSLNANDYSSRVANWDFQKREREIFLAKVKQGGKTLDLGSGSGSDARRFKDLGYEVLAVDGAEGMVKLALERGVAAKVLKFSELDKIGQKFDGVWASYSLLHISKADLPKVLESIRGILNYNGVLYASFREGEGEEMRVNDRYGGGRQFSYYSMEELKAYFQGVFTNIEMGCVQNRDAEKGGIYVIAWEDK